jgi:PHD/YefM family antitoxin component YafN of YafNO toxin-antitoxin module
MTDNAAWDALLETLQPRVSPEWMRHAREHGSQSWVRLILMVDAHHQLSNPGASEKVARTMSELASGRSEDEAGWEAIMVAAYDDRVAALEQLVATVAEVLPDELEPLFTRSIEPMGMPGPEV